MKIERIYIACYKHDFRFTRILVSSIRFWYPDIPISLIKDETYGPFDTRQLESVCNVDVYPAENKKFGWGFAKLEPLFAQQRQRCLILDSDIVFVGPVLDLLQQHGDDFVVTHEVPPDSSFVERLYFNLDELKRLDPAFTYPGFTFNTGQVVATTGIFKRSDFDPFVERGSPPALKQPDVFRCGEQGVLNYLLMKRQASGEISLARVRFMEVASDDICQDIRLAELTAESKYRFLIHWCGLTRDQYSPLLRNMIRADILLHFEDQYYARQKHGQLKRLTDVYAPSLGACLRSCVRGAVKAVLRR